MPRRGKLLFGFIIAELPICRAINSFYANYQRINLCNGTEKSANKKFKITKSIILLNNNNKIHFKNEYADFFGCYRKIRRILSVWIEKFVFFSRKNV